MTLPNFRQGRVRRASHVSRHFTHNRMDFHLAFFYSIPFRPLICLILFCALQISSLVASPFLKEKLRQQILCKPHVWMDRQICKDLENYRNQSISLPKMLELFNSETHRDMLLVKFTITNNIVRMEEHVPVEIKGTRAVPIKKALETLCRIIGLPDITFYATLHDGLYETVELPDDFPLFVMSKEKRSHRFILFPDYESLNKGYQVWEGEDIEKKYVSWKQKKNCLVWRGSTAELPEMALIYENLHFFSRVRLCELSHQFPAHVDAKFTIYYPDAASIPYLVQFRGERMSFADQLLYKYHILIDGYATAYSNSGWKFFSNSVVFKPESRWVQWYFNELEPNVHYIPLHSDLSDLPEKLAWAMEHDENSKKIAKNARNFALTHLTRNVDLVYLYHLIMAYSKLDFID